MVPHVPRVYVGFGDWPFFDRCSETTEAQISSIKLVTEQILFVVLKVQRLFTHRKSKNFHIGAHKKYKNIHIEALSFERTKEYH